MQRYDPKAVESKWQRVWADERTWEVPDEAAGSAEKSYVLEMLPYPSGEPHMGHLKCYSIGDAIAHYHRRTGRRVLHPMGYDAFGLPAENHAIKTGQHPRDSTESSIAEFRRQFLEWGISIDWTREFGTHEPRYYRWTQWIFLRLLERGLAYRGEATVNWCPRDETVLANEQVIGGRCERCDTPVVKRKMTQWFFRITDYADELLRYEGIDWPERVRVMQTNWIGRSEGVEISFAVEGHSGARIKFFTTRPDTIYGATFMVLAPEHPLVAKITTADRRMEVDAYVARARNMAEIERTSAEREKTGVDTGAFARNEMSGDRIPIWVADYVLSTYGTGAILAVPAHDERDFEVAKRYRLQDP